MDNLSTSLAPEVPSDKAAAVSGTGAVQGSQAASQPATAPSLPKEQPANGGALNEDNSTWLANKGFKSNDDIVNSYRNLERQLGNAVTLPDETKPEEIQKFRAKLGVPDKPDGYELKLPDGLPETMPYPDEDVKAFREWAHDAGLTPKQAQALHDKFVGHQAQAMQGWQQQLTERLTQTQAELIKENGPTDGHKFQAFVGDAVRGLNAVDKIAPGMRQELVELGALVEHDGKPYPASARVMKVLAKLGTLFGEDGGLIGSGTTAGADNPFAPGHSYNVTQQALLRRTDPDRARALYLQAGGDPRRWR
jgi:hypothetical protein